MDIAKFTWTREPKSYSVAENKITVTTLPHTDLWQRTYYHFRNDNAPVFQMETEEKFFSFAEFIGLVKDRIIDAGIRGDICGDCSWDYICREKKSRYEDSE